MASAIWPAIAIFQSRPYWLEQGSNVCAITPLVCMPITDRAKDMIKSGGEWIFSSDLENAAMGHSAVAEAAVIGIPHEKWQERPPLVVLKPVGAAIRTEMHALLAERGHEMVAAERRSFSRRATAHSNGQVAEDGAARAVARQGSPQRPGLRRCFLVGKSSALGSILRRTEISCCPGVLHSGKSRA